MSIEPVDALRRIAFLLERSRASTYRVKAYRQAADTLLAIPEKEVRERVRHGTLKQLEGIGPSTAAVIEQAAAGQVPTKLADLEAKVGGPLVEGGEQVRAQLRGDLHSHSDWSDGGSPIQEMVATAMEIGHDYLALTDHSPRLTVANGLTAARLIQQLKVVDAINAAVGEDFRLLKAIEVDILDDGSLDQTDELLDQLDVRVASVHSKLKMESSAMTRRMVAAVRNPRTNILGHCTGRLVTGDRGTRAESTFDASAVFAACVESNTAVEINSRPERSDPPDDLLTLAIGSGCLFSINTDAHAPGQLDFQAYGCERAERLGVPVERIVNSWPLEQLLEWTSAP
ncbi:PHP domain-containing protein [Ornithinimicrobium cryptoxanthini]|uniref:PHP domain-containing protein n=1 Tax=Ornithinimicrobium cryptoxanthini TaxID=2934161 RepID=A0ABY4YGK8_9MICO|nr:PHP domain-containing protein [Ornithinimicrobium cryptoxanthini]USQ75892.1 PHP domain-containing protein [Ornithinimicrobium cryptoxanthini]